MLIALRITVHLVLNFLFASIYVASLALKYVIRAKKAALKKYHLCLSLEPRTTLTILPKASKHLLISIKF